MTVWEQQENSKYFKAFKAFCKGKMIYEEINEFRYSRGGFESIYGNGTKDPERYLESAFLWKGSVFGLEGMGSINKIWKNQLKFLEVDEW